MRESIGSIALYNIIIVFIVVTFAILAGTMSYSKAFKVNNRIINAIEKYEGYNEFSSPIIDRDLLSIGYQSQSRTYDCSKRNGYNAMINLNQSYNFCVYEMPVETNEWKDRYVEYGVVSYIYLDFPLLGEFIRVPVYGVSRKIFKFSKVNAPKPDVTKTLGANYNTLGEENRALNDGWLTFDVAPSSIREYVAVYIKDNTGGIISWDEYQEGLSEVTGNCGNGYKCCQATFSYPSIGSASVNYRVNSKYSCQADW